MHTLGTLGSLLVPIAGVVIVILLQSVPDPKRTDTSITSEGGDRHREPEDTH